MIDRAELAAPGRPLGKERWVGVIDTVGSHTPGQCLRHHPLRRRAWPPAVLAGGMDFLHRHALHPARRHPMASTA